MPWPKRPVIYEINTWTWLHELSQRDDRIVTLGSIPAGEWDGIACPGIDAVWLMGVWERSPAGIRISLEHPALQAEYLRALPDATVEDVVGSPYCIHRYVVDQKLGGPGGLCVARAMLAERGIRLILDYVPNHVAPDHPWVSEHPEYFIHGNEDDIRRAPAEFFEANGIIIACGRDPYFPPWTDTAQLNAFHPGLRQAAIETICQIADQCDGMRCDMAMLAIRSVFGRTWGPRAGTPPGAEYWVEVLSSVRRKHPNAVFIAEAYWDLEWELQQQGFDYCYDKRLYDRLLHDHAEGIRLHLLADLGYQEKLVRFIENHDEPRAAATFGPAQSRAAALTVATLPGARLFHEGQFEGRKVKLPVQLGRRPDEPVGRDLQAFYMKLLAAMNTKGLREGDWQLCERAGWPDNPSFMNLVAWSWKKGDERYLIVVNLSDLRSQGRIQVPWSDLGGRTWTLRDVVSADLYERRGDEMEAPGLFVDLDAWRFHFLKVT